MVNVPSNDGTTPLMTAVKYEMEEMVQPMLHVGAEVNAADSHGSLTVQFLNNLLLLLLLLLSFTIQAYNFSLQSDVSFAIVREKQHYITIITETKLNLQHVLKEVCFDHQSEISCYNFRC